MTAQSTWHALPVTDALAELNADRDGLSEQEAAKRLAQFGHNELPASGGISAWSVLLSQFKNVLIVILLIATVISAFMGHAIEAIAIAVIVLFAILLGFVQEYRAERALQALRRISAPSAVVIRAGDQRQLPARDLVPGDIVMLAAGDKVPADLRLIEAFNLKLNEAVLTGESVPVTKQADALADRDQVVAERNNMGYSGTVVTYGRGLGVVVSTGTETEFGKITGLLRAVSTARTPLQKNLDRVGRALALVALLTVLAIVALGLARGADLLDMFIFGVALAVAVVPEALPAVVTISLAIGVQRMVKRNALIRHLPAVETLGSTSVICSDKTGTLTKDEMTARRLYVDDQWFEVTGSGYEPHGEFLLDQQAVQPSPVLCKMLTIASACSDAQLKQTQDNWEIQGDPTEAALIVAAAKAGIDKQSVEKKYPRVDEIPFTSERKRMTTLHRMEEGMVAASKGAPEVIISTCDRVLGADGVRPANEQDREQWRAAAIAMAETALRVLAVAYKPDATVDSAESNMIFLGLLGVIDPPRPEVKQAIATCARAGIIPVMITGDHPKTADAVAREIGLSESGTVITGKELEQMNDRELRDRVLDIDVYARVSPEHKLRIVSAWQHHGHVVAMTGDGINDAPALKKADVGIAMGITGTDVTREAAAMTLTDDNFASIVGAVEEGRGIFGNIKKYLMYLLSSNIGEIGLVAAATFAGMPLPLTAVQILYVNLATDGLPALALAVDPPERDLMQQPPRDPRAGIFTRPVVFLMLAGGVWSTIVNLSLFAWALSSDHGLYEAMALTFVSLVIIQFLKAYNFRSERQSIMRRPFANKWLNLAIFWELGLLILILYTPFLQTPFSTFSFNVSDWLIVLLVAATIVPVLELAKWLVRRGWFAPGPDRLNNNN